MVIFDFNKSEDTAEFRYLIQWIESIQWFHMILLWQNPWVSGFILKNNETPKTNKVNEYFEITINEKV